MEKFVTVKFDVKCKWQGFYPEYRIYVNDELFTERTFKYHDGFYINEMLQIKAKPGVYQIYFEQLAPAPGKFTIGSPYIEQGDAIVLDDTRFEILE